MVILEDPGHGHVDRHASTIMGKSNLLTYLGFLVDSYPCDDLVNGTMIPSSLEESLPHAKIHNESTFF